MLSTAQWAVLIAAGVVAVLAVFTQLRARAARRRLAALKRRFGPEYNRDVEQRASARRPKLDPSSGASVDHK